MRKGLSYTVQVSVILVSYNTRELLKNCLLSVFEKTQDVEYEVYVVDNNSADGSVEMLENEFPQVKLIKNKENKGFGTANNIAIKDSQAEYVFLLNTDTILTNNAIKIFYDFMENSKDTKIACCGGHLYSEDAQTVNNSYGVFPNLTELFLMVLGARNLFKLLFREYYYKHVQSCIIGLYKTNEIVEVDYIIGADLFIKKAVLDKIGAFDEDFFMFYEDTELGYRIKNRGFKSMIIPDAKIIHLESKSFNNNNMKKMKLYKKSEYLYFEKCQSKASAAIARFLYYFIYLKQALQFLNKDYLKLFLLNYKV